jgi:hypothetical protein
VVPCDRPAGTEIVQNANSHNAYETSPATPAALTYECWIHIRIHTNTHTHGMRARLQGGSMRGQAHAHWGSDRGDEGKGGGEDGGRGWRGGRRETVEGRTQGVGGAGQAFVLPAATIAPQAVLRRSILELCWQETPKKSKLRASPPPSLPPFLPHSLSRNQRSCRSVECARFSSTADHCVIPLTSSPLCSYVT